MTDPDCRYPILGAYYQPRGGTGRHDAVAWGYARGADQMGVDIIQNCEVTGIMRDGGKVDGLQTIERRHQDEEDRRRGSRACVHHHGHGRCAHAD